MEVKGEFCELGVEGEWMWGDIYIYMLSMLVNLILFACFNKHISNKSIEFSHCFSYVQMRGGGWIL